MNGNQKLIKQTGVIFLDDPEGQREIPTFTCPHCMRVGEVNKDDGGWCFNCQRLICKDNQCHGECRPFLREVERNLVNLQRLKQYGLTS